MKTGNVWQKPLKTIIKDFGRCLIQQLMIFGYGFYFWAFWTGWNQGAFNRFRRFKDLENWRTGKE
ncbi:hypothetical protein ACFFWB_27530 [Flavobacterium procerum]|uniref:hypothetical protein n=1 Tax=Flavobacterium procerum TaxID=1455569 RepID=UPI0035EF1CF5